MAIKKREFAPEAIGALQGVRVLDLSRLVCGNTLTQVLADHGAEVAKIEPVGGDSLRDWKTAGKELHWKNLSRNKKSLCLNFRSAGALDLLRRLAGECDVLVESFRPGTLESMGLSPDQLHELNPKLIIVRISGWGQTGPYAKMPGFGTLVEGMSGFAHLSGYPDRPPLLPPCALADSIAGYVGAMATLVALRHVEVGGGKGQVVDLSLFDPMFSVLGPQAAQYMLTGEIKQRTGSRTPSAAPRNVYQTSDGLWISLSGSIQQMAMRLFVAIGRPEMCEDPKFKTNAARVANADELDEIIGGFIRRMSQDQAIKFFQDAEVTVAPICDISQIVANPHFQERETIVDLPDEDIGTVTLNPILPKLDQTPGNYFRPAPRLGEHNEEILSWIGMSGEEIDKLSAEGVIEQAEKVTA